MGKSFHRLREDANADIAQSALTIIFKLAVSILPRVILIVLDTVNLQFLGQFVPISLGPILRIVAAYVVAKVWPSHS